MNELYPTRRAVRNHLLVDLLTCSTFSVRRWRRYTKIISGFFRRVIYGPRPPLSKRFDLLGFQSLLITPDTHFGDNARQPAHVRCVGTFYESQVHELGGTPSNNKPGFWATFGESGLRELRVGFEVVRLDGFDLPAGGEGGAEVISRDAPRAKFSGFFVAEAHQKHTAARVEDVGEARDVLAAIVVGEDVEQAGVDDGVEAVGQVGEFGGVGDAEVDFEISFGGFRPGAADRFFEIIEADDLVALRGEVERHVAGAAADVEHRAFHSIGNRGESRLDVADVPRRFAGVGLFERLLRRDLSHGVVEG